MNDSRYLDFELLIERSGPGLFVRVLRSPVGEGSGPFTMPSSPVELENVLLRLTAQSAVSARRGSPVAEIASAFGSRLFDALFDGPIRSMFITSREIATREGAGLRLLLRLGDDPSLRDIPWELLYDGASAGFLGLSNRTPIVRYAALPERVRPLRIDLPLRVLAVLASPSDLSLFDVQAERAKLDRVSRAGSFEFRYLERPTLHELQRLLRQGPFHILHFVGHGVFDERAGEGVLFFEDADGRSTAIGGSSLGRLLGDHDPLRLAVLDACAGARTGGGDPFAATAEVLLRRGVPAVVASKFELSDAAALSIWSEFYRALAEGLPVDAALAEGRKAAQASLMTVEWASPSLYSRVADGRIFDIVVAGVKSAPGTSATTEPVTPAATALEREVDASIERMLATSTVDDITTIHRTVTVPEVGDRVTSLIRTLVTASRDVEAALRQAASFNQREALRRVDEALADLVARAARTGQLAASVPATPYETRYAERLGRVGTSWRALVGARVAALEEEAERLQEIDSPYIVGVPLTPQEDVFIGRRSISARIQQLLLERRTPSLLLYGQRRMGKTSLLYNLGRLLPSSIVPLFVDLQGPPTQADSHSGFLFHLATAMADSARQHRELSVLVPPREAFSGDPFSRFYEWLEDFEAITERRTSLLMLDEFEALDRAFAAGRFDSDQVLGMLRHLIQHRSHFNVLLAGSHTLAEFERWSSFLINVQVVKVGYLTDDEARQLVERPVADFALRYEPGASDRVISLTRGHPFLLQLLCAELVALKNEGSSAVRRTASLADVEAAVPRALASGTMFFSDIERNQVDPDALAVLRHVAAAGPAAVVPEWLVRESLTGDIARAIDALLARDLIEEVPGGLRVQVELIRRWFSK